VQAAAFQLTTELFLPAEIPGRAQIDAVIAFLLNGIQYVRRVWNVRIYADGGLEGAEADRCRSNRDARGQRLAELR
jgi:hypothetical protein